MVVLKFGGTSVANPENMAKVLNIVKDAIHNEGRVLVVLSALGGITNKLLEAASQAVEGEERYQLTIDEITDRHVKFVKEAIQIQRQSTLLTRVKELCNEIEDICKGIFLVKELTAHSKDRISGYGEILSTTIFSELLSENGIENTLHDSSKLVKTNSDFGKATVDMVKTKANIEGILTEDRNQCLVFQGFIGSDHQGRRTTLGRGGSDYTASILGAIAGAKRIEIWTDVSGMMTADPSLVKNAKVIHEISYEEALELSHFGAKVIYPQTISPALQKQIPVLVKNTFDPGHPGTSIQQKAEINGNPIRGISSMRKVAVITLEGSGMIGIPGISKRLFETLAQERINVILISQSSSEYSICVAIEEALADQAKIAIDNTFSMEIATGMVKPVQVERSLSIVALVGDNMKRRAGMSGKMFSALGRNGINVRAIAQGSSERNISAVILETDVRKAINVLHEEFFENTYKQINLYICGTGNVGKKLMDQIMTQQQVLKDKMRIQLRVVGLANSRKQLFSDEQINPDGWQQELNNGDPMQIDHFIQQIISDNKRNAVFVDMTASNEVAMQYPKLLEKSISVIACNKIACSSSNEYYQQLKSLAYRHNAVFLFETNVGAGLPVLGTLNDLLRSGDEVVRIEAVLSGTLNFIFNHYTGENTFSEVVKQAAAEGYTEPDPRLDLSGIDVMRKILILARESGYSLELGDIQNNSFLPKECLEGELAEFYPLLEKYESHFQALVTNARSNGKKLKYVAEFSEGKAKTGLKEIDDSHDSYHLYGKDNIVAFYTKRYPEQPLVIKGAGAGAEVTASGVFADILRAIRS